MKTIKAVVGVLYNNKGQILIAKRQNFQIMGGFWELPGGKIKTGEKPQQAIRRELKEELGIDVGGAKLYKKMCHQYEDRLVKLSIYNVIYQGLPKGVEGQEIAWTTLKNLQKYKLLPTMRAFVGSIILPQKYWITPSSNHKSNEWLKKFEKKLTEGTKLIQLRSKALLDSGFIDDIYNKCKQNNTKLLLNTIDKNFAKKCCDGWHITTGEMTSLKERPCSDNKILGASTHNLQEAFKAQEIGADFIVISPVQATKTHPDTAPLGWQAATKVADKINIPVYFLGGMRAQDLDKSLKLGAQGIAGVSAF